MAKRTTFDRDAHGRFAVSIGGGGDRKPIRVPTLKRPKLGDHVTMAHVSKKSGRRTAVTRFSTGYDSANDRLVTMREQYDRGQVGPVQPHPRGGTYKPPIRLAGWKRTGTQRKS